MPNNPYINKVQFGNQVIIDITDTTATASKILSGFGAYGANGAWIDGTIVAKNSGDITALGSTVTVPSGYYASNVTKSVSSGSAATPATTITANPSILIDNNGLITANTSATKSVTPTVSAGYVSSGTAGTITVSGSNTLQLSTQAGATITPTESQQTAVASGKYTLGNVTVAAIPSKYKDTTGADAVASQVLSGKKFVNSTGLVTGTMTDRGAVNKVLTTARDEDVYTVPSGYHNGSGVVRIYPEIKSGIIPTKRTSPFSGGCLYNLILSKITAIADCTFFLVCLLLMLAL